MCVQPGLVLEKRSKHQRYVPMVISFGARRERAGITQKVAPMLHEFSLAVEPLFRGLFTSADGMIATYVGHRVTPDYRSLPYRVAELAVNIAHIHEFNHGR
jgi:hypothetical protein